MRVHGDDGGEIFHFEFPDGFRRAELFHHMDIADALDALGEHLRGTADGVEINAAVFFASLQGFVAHAALANHAAQTKIANHLPLVGLLANGSGGTGGGAFPIPLFVLDDDRPAVIKNSVL